MSCTLPSENVPVAVNCCVTPSGRVGFCGVTEIEVGIAALTINEAVPLTESSEALIVEVPGATAWASPIVGAALLMVAAEVLEEDQVTVVVRFCLLLSLYVPVAMNCWVVPAARVTGAGVMEIETRPGVIVRPNDPLTPLRLAIAEH